MDISFAYSFDRETFHGNYETRQEALRQALGRLRESDESAEMIYVGKRVPVDPGSSGLAELILGAMRRRVRDQTGDAASQYLLRVDEHALAELDSEIDRIVRAWLAKHQLQPTHTRIVAISEHPVPTPRMLRSDNGESEVTELGETEYQVFSD